MTIKRIILSLLTILAIARVSFSLNDSLSQPQIQSRLELYQTNLVLQVSELQSSKAEEMDIATAIDSLIGNSPYETAAKQYQKARQEAQLSRDNFQKQLQQLASSARTANSTNGLPKIADSDTNVSFSLPEQAINQEILELNKFIDEIDIKQGILETVRDNRDKALDIWKQVIKRADNAEDEYAQTATILINLWQENPQSPANSAEILSNKLDGWFRYQALSRLYAVAAKTEVLNTIQTQEQQLAYQSLFKLAVISGIPVFGGIGGVLLSIFLIAQLFIKPEQSILATNRNTTWETPWNWEIIWQVLIVGFFFIGQFALPFLLGLSGLNPANASLRIKALYVLGTYITMAISGILVLYFSLKPFLPLPQDWFKFKFISNWFIWGFGGYLIAIPSVLIVSLINQQIWHGQGGSNPLLFLALQAQDKLALAIFFSTASIAAPIFEEIMFRGFLLPSLTRYIPVWGAIILSGLIFAIAHLSLSEVLPLATLGIILGVVYTRSRNLLAPMLLHSLWNSGTLISLFVLGSGI